MQYFLTLATLPFSPTLLHLTLSTMKLSYTLVTAEQMPNTFSPGHLALRLQLAPTKRDEVVGAQHSLESHPLTA